MLKIVEIYRSNGEDYTRFLLCRHTIRLNARPIRLWKFVYWKWWERSEQRVFAIQSPWISITVSR